MGSRQDLKLEIEDFLYEYKDAIVSYLESHIAYDYVECNDCGHEVYVGCSESVEAAEKIIKIITDDMHSQTQLIHLTLAGDFACNLIHNTTPVSTISHQQFDDAMKGLS